MIRYLKQNEIDKKKWDTCIKESFNGQVYAWSWYLDIVHPNWNALVEDDYARVFPLTGNRKLGVSYLYQPFFAQQLGVFSPSILNPEIVNSFLQAIPAHYQFAEIRLNTHNKTDDSIFKITQHINYELDLINTYDRISKKYASNTKRNLKKAQQSGISLMKNIKPEDVVRLFRANRGRTISHWNDLEYNRLKKLVYTAIYRGQAMVYGVYTAQNNLCAGAIFIRSQGKIVFLFSGANQQAKDNHAMTYLIDAVIQEHAPSHLVFDFEGSDNESLARFYKGFGSKQTTYPGVEINRLPFLIRHAVRLLKRR
jgi:hypothetical protein